MAFKHFMRAQYYRRIVLVVGAVGEMLRFQTNGSPHGITFPVFPDEIARHPLTGLIMNVGLA